MKITAIEPKKKGLSALYIDGEFALKIDTETVLSYRIDVGDEIDDEKLKEVIDASNIKRAKDKAMWLISYRDHSKKELIDKVAKDSSYEAATKAVERLQELGLINDERYAKRYATDLLSLKHLSKSAAVRKLCDKGIDRDLARDTVDELDVDIYENIRAVINKKYSKNLFDEKGRRRCVNGLVRLGYSYSDIKAVLSEYTDIDYCD
ncbi:MAG: RecX family transcriptional regulator [Ruminococcus sp.]|nr:RecX family transcriptional regulator [Ruminococcus sp.]MBQ7133938.1 RecX family transcriptional regulator [Ruminococcus sp.]